MNKQRILTCILCFKSKGTVVEFQALRLRWEGRDQLVLFFVIFLSVMNTCRALQIVKFSCIECGIKSVILSFCTLQLWSYFL